MAIKSSLQIDKTPSAASMTDLMFLLLLFMFMSLTLINPNALQLSLPRSSNDMKARPVASVSIDADLNFYLGTDGHPEPIDPAALGTALTEMLAGIEDPLISLHTDRSVPIEEVVRVMNIAKENRYRLILATAPLDE